MNIDGRLIALLACVLGACGGDDDEQSTCETNADCGGEFACAEHQCEYVACRDDAQCGDDEFCIAGDGCYPLSGSCAAQPCPKYYGNFDPSCIADFCQVPQQPSFGAVDAFGPISLTTPVNGARAGSLDELAFEWYVSAASRGKVSVGLFVAAAPKPPSRTTSLLWELWFKPDENPSAAYADGTSSVLSPDRGAARDVLIFGRAFSLGRVVGQTQTSLVRIGANWSAPGDSCDATLGCGNPSLPLACVDDTCRIRCASNADCRQYGKKASITDLLICGADRETDGRFCKVVPP